MATEKSEKVRRTVAAREARDPADEPIDDWRARALEAESADEERLRAELPAAVLDLAVQLGGDKQDAAAEWKARVKKAARLIARVNAAPMSAIGEAVNEALTIGTIAENGGAGGLSSITARRMGISRAELSPSAPGAASHWQELSKAFAIPRLKTGRPAGLTGVPQYLELVAWARRDGLPAGFQAQDPEKPARGLAHLLVAIGIPATWKPARPRPHDAVPALQPGFLPAGHAGPRVYVFATEVGYLDALAAWKHVQVEKFTQLIRDAARDDKNRRDAQRSDAHVEEKS